MPTILVIDDSALMRKLSRGYLEEAGYDVEEYLPDSVSDLALKIRNEPPDLVLSDFNMPNVDGLNVTRTVKRVEPDMPIVILTANRDPTREALLQTMGVRRILYKPVQEADLVEAVRKALTKL